MITANGFIFPYDLKVTAFSLFFDICLPRHHEWELGRSMCDEVGWQDPDCGQQEQIMASGNYKNWGADREEKEQILGAKKKIKIAHD